eukprot:gb/GECG01004264.1/.p1 GENE.gb/GECG01004264.1/~~gb/GECG01004264.1/.p1  ORF type:complete len:108 (+),score=7.47 gb/GECG01004264.1/:1-324(+)
MELVLERLRNIFTMRFNCLGDYRPCWAHEDPSLVNHTQWCFGGGGFGGAEEPTYPADPKAETLTATTLEEAEATKGLNISEFCGLSFLGAFSHYGMNVTAAEFVSLL